MIEHFTFHLLLHNAHLLDSISGLHKLCQPASLAARKWRENENMKRKWREIHSLHFLFISTLPIHYLYQQDQGASVQKTVWTVKRCIYMEVYFHFYWLWWALVDWALQGCSGLYWAVLGSTGLYWAVLSCTGLWLAVVDCNEVHWAILGGVNSYFSVYSPIFGMVKNNQPTNQPGDPSASLLLTSVRRQSFAKIASFCRKMLDTTLLSFCV